MRTFSRLLSLAVIASLLGGAFWAQCLADYDPPCWDWRNEECVVFQEHPPDIKWCCFGFDRKEPLE